MLKYSSVYCPNCGSLIPSWFFSYVATYLGAAAILNLQCPHCHINLFDYFLAALDLKAQGLQGTESLDAASEVETDLHDV